MRYLSLSVGILVTSVGLTQGLMAADAATPSTGVAGDVTLSPTCPGPVRPDRNCAGPFPGALVELLNAQGRPVGSAVSSAEGRFEIKAPAGSYELKVKIDGAYPRCEAVPVRIKKKQQTRAHIECDSGMR